MHGLMCKDVQLTGTDLKLTRGQLVDLTPAANIPNGNGRYYASPAFGFEWGDASILLDPDDVHVFPSPEGN